MIIEQIGRILMRYAIEYDTRLHECETCADLSPIETELVAQARLITNAKYEAKEQRFTDELFVETGTRGQELLGWMR